MRRETRDGVIFYASEQLTECRVTHALTTRHGGVSAAPYDSLNLGHTTGDAPEHVHQNHARLYAALAVAADSIVTARQAQADRWMRVDEHQRGTRIDGVDALITNVPRLPLMLRFADCVPILLVDPAQGAIAAIHAGWRGTTGRIVEKTVRAMMHEFGTRPADLRACIGPSIGPCCYAIGPDVTERVRAAFPSHADRLLSQNTRVHFDLWEGNALQLRELGVERIEVAALCTADRTDDFYSWRKENAQTGRLAALIALP